MTASVIYTSDQIENFLEALPERGFDGAKLWDSIGFTITGLVEGTFRSQSDPWGDPWEPLSPEVASSRPGKQILIDQGILRSSFDYESDDRSATVGMDVLVEQYGPAHQFGAMTGRNRNVKLPARPMLPVRNGEADLPQSWQDQLIQVVLTSMENLANEF